MTQQQDSEHQPRAGRGVTAAILVAVALLLVALFFLFHELKTPVPHHVGRVCSDLEASSRGA